MKGHIYHIAGTTCIMLKDNTGRYIATAPTVRQAFQKLSIIKATA